MYRDRVRLAGEHILQLGDPALRRAAAAVGDAFSAPEIRDMSDRLHRVLAAFRQQRGFGRAIAATQLGFDRRVLALDLGSQRTLLDPVITEVSEETFCLWDDCLSFPDLLVYVRRHVALTVTYRDLDGHTYTWAIRDRATAELLQHEIDHLDGVLAVDHATGSNPFALRGAFDRHFARDTAT